MFESTTDFSRRLILENPDSLIRGCYFQVGEEVKLEMRVDDAYAKSLETVLHWLHSQVNLSKTQVFFRTFSPVHFRLNFSFPTLN